MKIIHFNSPGTISNNRNFTLSIFFTILLFFIIHHFFSKLQEQSLSMNIKLKNRQAIKDELSQFIDEMLVPKPMIVAINELEPTEQDFIEQLHELSHKINVVKEQSYKGRNCFIETSIMCLKYNAVYGFYQEIMDCVWSL